MIIIALAALLLAQEIIPSTQIPPRIEPETIGPFSTYINVTLDLAGKPDLVNGGASDSFASKAEFHPPPRYRTRIIRVDGDFLAYVKSGPIPVGTSSEVGFGLKTTAPDGDARVSYPGYTVTPYANSFVWVQDAVTPTHDSTRMAFDRDTTAGGLLESDNTLLIQSFVAMNTTGLKIHMEPTFCVWWVYEREAKKK